MPTSPASDDSSIGSPRSEERGALRTRKGQLRLLVPMSVRLESVSAEFRRYGDRQVRVELASVFICDDRTEALTLLRRVAEAAANAGSTSGQ